MKKIISTILFFNVLLTISAQDRTAPILNATEASIKKIEAAHYIILKTEADFLFQEEGETADTVVKSSFISLREGNQYRIVSQFENTSITRLNIQLMKAETDENGKIINWKQVYYQKNKEGIVADFKYTAPEDGFYAVNLVGRFMKGYSNGYYSLIVAKDNVVPILKEESLQFMFSGIKEKVVETMGSTSMLLARLQLGTVSESVQEVSFWRKLRSNRFYTALLISDKHISQLGMTISKECPSGSPVEIEAEAQNVTMAEQGYGHNIVKGFFSNRKNDEQHLFQLRGEAFSPNQHSGRYAFALLSIFLPSLPYPNGDEAKALDEIKDRKILFSGAKRYKGNTLKEQTSDKGFLTINSCMTEVTYKNEATGVYEDYDVYFRSKQMNDQAEWLRFELKPKDGDGILASYHFFNIWKAKGEKEYSDIVAVFDTTQWFSFTITKIEKAYQKADCKIEEYQNADCSLTDYSALKGKQLSFKRYEKRDKNNTVLKAVKLTTGYFFFDDELERVTFKDNNSKVSEGYVVTNIRYIKLSDGTLAYEVSIKKDSNDIFTDQLIVDQSFRYLWRQYEVPLGNYDYFWIEP